MRGLVVFSDPGALDRDHMGGVHSHSSTGLRGMGAARILKLPSSAPRGPSGSGGKKSAANKRRKLAFVHYGIRVREGPPCPSALDRRARQNAHLFLRKREAQARFIKTSWGCMLHLSWTVGRFGSATNARITVFRGREARSARMERGIRRHPEATDRSCHECILELPYLP